MRLLPEDHAAALAKRRWKGISDKDRAELMQRVRAAKKRRPRQSDTFAYLNESLKFQNVRSRKER